MIKKVFSLKSIVYSRLILLSALFVAFLMSIMLLSSNLIKKLDVKYSNMIKENLVDLIESKINAESYYLESSFIKLHLIADQNNGAIEDIVKNISLGENTRLNLYKQIENSFILRYSSAEKPSNTIGLNSEIVAVTSSGGSKIYKTITNDSLFLNGYFGYTYKGDKYIVQIGKITPMKFDTLNELNIHNDQNYKFVDFNNEEIIYTAKDTNKNPNAHFIPMTKQYIEIKSIQKSDYTNVYVIIFIGLLILFICWLITEIFYYKFSTKPIIEITNSLNNILENSSKSDFKEQHIEEYDKISTTIQAVIDKISLQQQQMETLLNRLPIPVAVIDINYNFLYRNSSFNTLLSLPDDLSDQNFLDIIPETLKSLETNITAFLNSPKQKDKFELYDPKKNEYFIVRFGKITNESSKITNTIILFNDITFQKRELENQKRRKEEIENILLNIEESVMRLTSSSKELRMSAESLSTMLAQQNTSLAETNVAIQELSTSADSILNKTSHILDVSNKVDKASQIGFNEVEKSFNKINSVIKITDTLTDTIFQLNKKTHNISKILKTIYEISEQTNLLALNASIESVRGDSNSMSFKIIAEEIRELSDKTYGFSKEIEKELEDITDVGSNSVMIVEEAEKLLKDTFEHMQENKGNFEVIKNEADHINKHLIEINNVIKDLNNATNDVLTTSNDLAIAMKDALNSANESQQASKDVDAVIKNLNETLAHLDKLK
ncbi:methyl-accepting chemotaxis protein [Deferribacterales bacterium Es71-Z0220]|uniref:methyl-accepting chemotaxis protein n=1 Tax=Deferrivibrio essentukiensis TaxID=2880922 RepID=UPI001F607B11|nr:methyl-accepting chemotaxis protein [Deferrivibrio essentukiensis]MCB4203885.1 methyl-accepting chemotaxis protein [Deferrivibrio essentukiensis]